MYRLILSLNQFNCIEFVYKVFFITLIVCLFFSKITTKKIKRVSKKQCLSDESSNCFICKTRKRADILLKSKLKIVFKRERVFVCVL